MYVLPHSSLSPYLVLMRGLTVIMANVHPFFGGLPIQQAAGWTWDYFHQNEYVLPSSPSSRADSLDLKYCSDESRTEQARDVHRRDGMAHGEYDSYQRDARSSRQWCTRIADVLGYFPLHFQHEWNE
jgi:hypothetical protein